MSNWLVLPAVVLLMVGCLVGVAAWWRWVQTFREPTYDEMMNELRADWEDVQIQLWEALGIPKLVDRLAAILERLDRDAD